MIEQVLRKMIRMRVLFFALLMIGSPIYSIAQKVGEGNPIIVLFGDYTAGLGKANDVSGFNLTRSRLGYNYQATASLKATVVLDINAFDNNTRTANFHYAMLEWACQDFSLSGGLIYLSQFEEQESFWGRRYIEKSFQDLYGFGHDSDLGLKLKYRFVDWLSADFAVTNGEGTLYLNSNNRYKYGFGVTAKPINGLTLRAYADLYSKSPNLYPDAGSLASYENQGTVALFAGYSNDMFSLGAEYNHQMNRSFVEGCDYSGLSIYAGAPLGEKLGFYGRYDYVDTKTSDGVAYNWAFVNKNALIAGFEYKPTSQLSISPNYRYAESLSGDGRHAVSVNVGFSW